MMHKAAVICGVESLPDAEFWETVSKNRGLVVKVFTSIEEAENWIGQ
jgi:hypothetical protein